MWFHTSPLPFSLGLDLPLLSIIPQLRAWSPSSTVVLASLLSIFASRHLLLTSNISTSEDLADSFRMLGSLLCGSLFSLGLGLANLLFHILHYFRNIENVSEKFWMLSVSAFSLASLAHFRSTLRRKQQRRRPLFSLQPWPFRS